MAIPHVSVDFQNADPVGRIRLNTVGTVESLSRSGVRLANGLSVVVHDDELEADGVVSFSAEEKIWVATINWDAIRQLPSPSTVHRG
jgi:hypothetical protein